MPVSRARTGETEECCWVPLAQLGRERTVTEGGTRAPDAIHQRLQCGAKRFEFGFPQDAEHSTYEMNVGGIPSALDNGSMWHLARSWEIFLYSCWTGFSGACSEGGSAENAPVWMDALSSRPCSSPARIYPHSSHTGSHFALNAVKWEYVVQFYLSVCSAEATMWREHTRGESVHLLKWTSLDCSTIARSDCVHGAEKACFGLNHP